MSQKTQDLNAKLWNAANILRGSAVDRTDWKGYILPLLFFKRICDVWDEETAAAFETFGDTDPTLYPEVHRFKVPEGCHWQDIRETPTNVGTALKHAMQEIGFEPEDRKFSPHITLARIKSPGNANLLEAVLRKMEGFDMGISPVQSVLLYESILKPDGAVHKVLAEINSGNWK